MDNQKQPLNGESALGVAPEDLSPDQATGQFVNVPAEEMAETEMAGADYQLAQQEPEPEHLEDRVKTLSPAAVVARRFFRSKLSMVGLVTLIVLFFFSFLGPSITGLFTTSWDQDEADRSPGKLVEANTPIEYVDENGDLQIAYEYTAVNNSFNFDAMPGGDHILGTDNNGYDIFYRLMYGGRVSLTLGFVVVILQTLFGIVLGGLAGYFGKWVDMLIMRIVDMFACIPTLPIMLIISFVLQENDIEPMSRLYVMMAMLTLIGWSGVARMVRGQILSLREQEFMMAAEATGLKLGLAYGGDGYDKQLKVLESGVDILIGTTGRLIDYAKQNHINLGAIQVVVLDEADRMYDLGFIKDIRWLFRRMPPANQRLNMLFSATLSYRVRELAFEQMNNAEYIEVEPEQKTGHRIKEELFYPSNEEKMRLLQTLIEEEWPDRAIIFANTKHRCEEIWGHLAADGHRVGLLTGDVAQKKRLRILDEFTRGDLDILVATDVAARGLHIPAVTHVFNYDLPDDCEDYVHRIGRTGRAGASGHSISLACEEYALNLPAIETYIGHSIPVSKYNPDALMTDLPKPLRLTRPRTGNGPRRTGAPRNRRRSG